MNEISWSKWYLITFHNYKLQKMEKIYNFSKSSFKSFPFCSFHLQFSPQTDKVWPRIFPYIKKLGLRIKFNEQRRGREQICASSLVLFGLFRMQHVAISVRKYFCLLLKCTSHMQILFESQNTRSKFESNFFWEASRDFKLISNGNW